MKNSYLIDLLKDLGLSEHESKIYLASLSLGSSTVLKIARAAEVKRTTVYDVIGSLSHKGLMRIDIKGLKKVYTPENPEKLEAVLDSRRTKLRNFLPEFASLYNLKGGESFIKYYEGLEGVKTVYDGVLKDIRPHDFYFFISDMNQWYKIDEEYFEDFIQRRATIPLEIRGLTQDSLVARKLQRSKPIYKASVKILSKQTNLTTNLVVTPQKVVIHQLTHPIRAIVIENQSIIQMHREMFEIMWNSIAD